MLVALVPAMLLLCVSFEDLYFYFYSEKTSAVLLDFGYVVDDAHKTNQFSGPWVEKQIIPWIKFKKFKDKSECKISGQPQVFGKWKSDSQKTILNLLNEKLEALRFKSMNIFTIDNQSLNKQCALNRELNFILLFIFIFWIGISMKFLTMAVTENRKD
jgi:hypothetical protein